MNRAFMGIRVHYEGSEFKPTTTRIWCRLWKTALLVDGRAHPLRSVRTQQRVSSLRDQSIR